MDEPFEVDIAEETAPPEEHFDHLTEDLPNLEEAEDVDELRDQLKRMRLNRSDDDEEGTSLEALRRDVKEDVLILMDLDGLNSERFLLQFHILSLQGNKQLQATCKEMKIPISGTKHQLCHRILKHRYVSWSDDFSTLQHIEYVGSLEGGPSLWLLLALG